MRILGLLIVLLVSACSGNKSTVQNLDPNPDIAFTFEKTACFGECPEYKLTVFHENKATLVGERNLKFIGNFDCQDCDTDMMAMVVEMAHRIKFWEMEDRYDPGVTDLPSTIFTFYITGEAKQVINVMDGPEELNELEKLITDLYLKRKWVKTESK